MISLVIYSLLFLPLSKPMLPATQVALMVTPTKPYSSTPHAALSGRGMGGIGKGRGLAPIRGDGALVHVGVGRGLSAIGKGRGLASLGTGRGLAKLAHRIPPEIPPAPPEQPVPPSLPQSVAPAPEPSPADETQAPKPPPAKTPEITAYPADRDQALLAGDKKMAKKDWTGAGRDYFLAQQIEGFRGPANLRMAGVQLIQGRFYEGANNIHLYAEGKGTFRKRDLFFPGDETLKDRIDGLVKERGQDPCLLLCAATCYLGQGDGEEAARVLDALRRIDPCDPCLPLVADALERQRADTVSEP